MARRFASPGRIKIHRTYTVEEVARVTGAHENTVRQWLRQGLDSIDGRRPTLIHGVHLRNFLEARREKPRQVCGPGRIYCVKCRGPKEPAGGMADLIPMTPASGNLRGICPTCHTLIHRRVTLSKVDEVRGTLEVAFPHGQERIGESATPSVNCDSGEES